MNAIAQLHNVFGDTLIAASVMESGGAVFALASAGGQKELLIAAPDGWPGLAAFLGNDGELGAGWRLRRGPLSASNALALRAAVPHLTPVPLGQATSAGCGDRLGLATPGHVQAFHSVAAQPGAQPIAPLFAQQSIREMTRTRRTPSDVLRDATFGALEGGWRGPLGADADHLKTPADIDACAAAGFSFYTIDPGAHVDGGADQADEAGLRARVAALNWNVLEGGPDDLIARYAGRALDLDDHRLTLTPEAVWRAAAKYGNAVAHVAGMYRHLAGQGVPFELEVSVDETETPTTQAEHAFIALELQRLGVQWVSLAPRYVGRFEKGVDYLGDLAALRADLAGHAAVARALGPYKLSLHSGSDKFSVYPLIVAAARGRVHLKTAGTSYLEALRTLAQAEPGLFRAIAALAVERYPEDRASYHVSAELSRVPEVAALPDAALPGLLDQFDAREVLHVTFGSALARHEAGLKAALRAHEAAHYAAVEKHFVRHLAPFAQR